MKVGEQWFDAWRDVDNGRVHIEKLYVRSIRKGKAYLTERVPHLTWGRLSRKTGDYGWLPNPPRWMRHRVSFDQPNPYGKTKQSAVRKALASARRRHDHQAIAAFERWLERAST